MEKQIKYTRKDELIQLYSDMYKETYGVRPNIKGMYNLSEDELIQKVDSLHDQSFHVTEQEKEDQKQAISIFEAYVARVMELGSIDREQAIIWIDQAEQAQGDREYLCYLMNLPYTYFKQAI